MMSVRYRNRQRVPLQSGLFSTVGPRKGLDQFPAVYTRTGRTTHLLPILGSPNVYAPALCGLCPAMGDLWHGTGSEDEYDIAREQPLCSTCNDVVRRKDASALYGDTLA